RRFDRVSFLYRVFRRPPASSGSVGIQRAPAKEARIVDESARAINEAAQRRAATDSALTRRLTDSWAIIPANVGNPRIPRARATAPAGGHAIRRRRRRRRDPPHDGIVRPSWGHLPIPLARAPRGNVGHPP